ncbi:hypothetical protein C2S51_026220 [Perilla frutescens var. frutescens]|nr:hypothetical protein C2S51_026220 [Perilla frutescens var. frutescens]
MERPRLKCLRASPNLSEEQKRVISQLPPKMMNRCKSLMKETICFSAENWSLPRMLASWLKMKPQRADWLAVLKELERLDHNLYFEMAERAFTEESFEANIRDYTKIIHGYTKQNKLREAKCALEAKFFMLKSGSSERRPPSPLALPIIGHLHLLAPIPHQALAKLSKRYGPLIHLYLGSVPCIVASSPEVSKELLKTHESSFSDRPQTAATDYLTYGSQDFSIAPNGSYWKFMKKLCMSQLLGGQTLDLLQPVRRHEIRHLFQFLAKESGMIMSERCSGDEDRASAVRKLIQVMAELTGKFNLSDYIWFCKNLDLQGFGKRLKEVRDGFDRMMEKIIDEHQNQRRKSKDDGGKGEVLRDLLGILLDIAEDVQEIDSVIGKDRLVEESDIPSLPYLQAVVKETLRLHPTGPMIVRESSEDCTIAGYDIAAKTRLFVNVWALGRDPNHWEDALEFRPQRFLYKDNGQLDVRGQHYHFLPFGTGRRGCPGLHWHCRLFKQP